MNKSFIAQENCLLINFLREKISNKSKNNIKSLINKKMILVNNNIVIDPKYLLKKDDVVTIKNNYIFSKKYNLNIRLIYEDKDIIVVNKPSNLLTISTRKEREKTLYNIVREYLININKNNKIFIIHRLDKGTSGVIIFAKNLKAKNSYQNNWNKIVIKKEYVAIVKKGINKEGIIKSYLKENSQGKVYVSKTKEGKYSITEYKKLYENNKYALLKINIKTGRKNQIRVHLSEMKYPIIGDNKYGSDLNPIKRMCLHSKKIVMINPINNKKMIFDSNIPEEFLKLVIVK